MIKDSIGNPLAEGDAVSVAVGQELAVGKVIKIDDSSILLGSGSEQNLQAQQNPPMVYVQVILQRPVLTPQNWTIGVMKVINPKQT